MKSSTKAFIFFIIFAAIAAFLTFYPNAITLLPFKIPYVAKDIQEILQWGSYVLVAQALIIGIALKRKRL